MIINIGIIGYGLIGQKRHLALPDNTKLIACADSNLESISVLEKANIKIFENWNDLLNIPEIDLVIISTPHNVLAEIGIAALKSGKHVLIEKPAARNYKELEPLLDVMQHKGKLVHVGFNHRYHRSIIKAKEIIEAGKLGEIMFIRGRYGHGGRLGYDQEWRANKAVSGGGELIDQGSHLIDLSRWFFGEEFNEVNGFADTFYWDMEVDDNAFMILKTESKKTSFLQVSCTEWKNMFSMEIYGRDGKLDLSGLGGSYGVEKLTWYKMLPAMGPPDTKSWEYPMDDNSWSIEIKEFCQNIINNNQPSASLNDAYQVLKVINEIYQGDQ